MYWDIKIPLSYNALLNFIVGGRGLGKTHGCKRFVIDDFLKNKNQFIWSRRFDSEFDDFLTKGGKDGFFSDLRIHYEGFDLEYKGYNFYVNGDIAGFAIPLSVSAKKKSSSYPNVKTMVFDEFIIDRKNQHYLNSEVEIMLDLFETIFRLRDDGKAFFLANAITFTNPYFLYFDIHIPQNNKGIYRKGEVLIQIVKDSEFVEAKNKTRFGKLIKGTNYGNYAIDNKFLRDSNEFIIKQPENLRYFFTLKANGEHFGVWQDTGMLYVSRKFDPSYRLIYTTILDNHEPNTMLLKGINGSPVFGSFVKAFKMGCCYFDSIKTKNIVLETIKHTL